MAQIFNLKAVISAVDRVTGPMRAINAALRSPIKAMKDVVASTANAARQAAAPIVVAGGLLASAFGVGGASVLNTSAQFEKFQTILETVEGSSEKAKASMGWVSDFASKTPYELAGVTDAYVKLKAYGIDPQAGALKAAGDASAAMGKDLTQAVEALADATTGENERLKEFGITAETVGNKIAYRWVENGKSMVAVADKTNKGMIQKVVTGIWNSRFSGAMDKLSMTWDGMWSNLKDTVTRFQKYIGDGGFFDAAKGELSGILDLLNQWEADGTLKEIASQISGVLTGALAGLKANLAAVDWRAAWANVKQFAAAMIAGIEAIGGWGNALIVIAVILNAQTIVAVVQLIGSLGRLGIALTLTIAKFIAWAAAMTVGPIISAFVLAIQSGIPVLTALNIALAANPIGLVIIGIVALIAAIAAVIIYWDDLKAAVVDVAAAISAAFDQSVNWIVEKLAGLIGYATQVVANLKAIFSGDFGSMKVPTFAAGVASKPEIQSAVAAANTNIPAPANTNVLADPTKAGPNGPSPAIAAAAGRSQVAGEIKVSFDNAPPGMRVSNGQTNQPGLALNPNVGYRSMSVAG